MKYRTHCILGIGKLIKGMGAYAIVSRDWQEIPGNVWREAEKFKGQTVALMVEARKNR